MENPQVNDGIQQLIYKLIPFLQKLWLTLVNAVSVPLFMSKER